MQRLRHMQIKACGMVRDRTLGPVIGQPLSQLYLLLSGVLQEGLGGLRETGQGVANAGPPRRRSARWPTDRA